MFVVKRNGRKQPVLMDKITKRLEKLCFGLNIKAVLVAMEVVNFIYENVTTEELDMQAAKVAANKSYLHNDYALLAGRIMISNLSKKIKSDFSEVIERLYKYKLVTKFLYDVVCANKKVLNECILYENDYDYKYFGFKTLENGYLFKIDEQTAELPQQMLMRVSLGIHGDNIEDAIETYKLLSEKKFIHASPTLFAAGTNLPQLSSCFLVSMKEDSIAGIYNTLTTCALISKHGGGIGLNVHEIRARNSPIKATNGTSSGLESMLRVFNNMVRHVDQGGKRKGAMAIYLEPWHADIYDFLNLKRNMGAEDKKARDLLYALWVPDLFMKRVENGEMWSLMCPDACKGLDRIYGKEFEELYSRYESEKKYVKQVNARDLFRFIIETQVETGTPYMLYKDACNGKSNQKNLGTIKCSNLCAEIVQFNSGDETGVCNLASISVNKFVCDNFEYDFKSLKKVTKVIVKNLNKIIDVNFYPVNCARDSNFKHRPIGVGIQGLADTFVMLRLPYESDKAKLLNKQIAETIYYAALEASCELAKTDGPYSSYKGSPASEGLLQYDLWNVTPTKLWDWKVLKENIKLYGLRNSLLVAYMPTATTAQILGNNESFEPFTNNLYVRRVLAGDFQVVNQYLVDDLLRLNLYNDNMLNKIIANNGSIQAIEGIPADIKELYKTVWEMKQKNLIDMAADRAAFIDQSQSFNVFVANPTYSLMTSIHTYAWKKGLKTGMYYLRTKPAADPIKFTVDATCSKVNGQCMGCDA
ncbi:rr1 [Cryptophlebia peltastica nucleopolyhedrovirus]|uniref:Ribonucleoside-diphosphate reductase n=1 Tax=Cryptophlebia peltastica nucleopolyhedrovirus TaxID=2304025 RepID=A0A346RNZ5_9ABAC|nr:rr1 [Cryptophlebia peltastica nucleopolyhedrovirus]AXS67792.1 rr1 [Cryptophlebia peltastica nucleopolyhedrovirus]